MMDESKFIEGITFDELKIVRQRITGMILATDMAAHKSHIDSYQKLDMLSRPSRSTVDNNSSLIGEKEAEF